MKRDMLSGGQAVFQQTNIFLTLQQPALSLKIQVLLCVYRPRHWAWAKSPHAPIHLPTVRTLSHPPTPAAVPADVESATPESNTPDETETAKPAPVDDQERPPAVDDDAATPAAADSPEPPSGEEKAEATIVEAVTETAAVPDVTGTVDTAVVPRELDEAAANGEWQNIEYWLPERRMGTDFVCT